MTTLVRTPHPLTTQGRAVFVDVGADNLAGILARHGIDSAWYVEINGLQVPALMWSRTTVKDGAIIECRPVVHNNDVFRIAAIVAISYFTVGAGSGWLVGTGSLTGATGLAATFVGATAFYAGATLVNKVLPPSTPGQIDYASNNAEPTYSLSGGRNSARLWNPIGLVLGQPYCVPDLGAQPYTFYSGEDQYLTQIFNGGFNLQSVSNLKIGQTSLDTYESVQKFAKGIPVHSFIEGLPQTSVDTVAGGLIDAPSGNGDWVVRTTSPNTLSIGIDLEMTLFSVSSSNGAWTSNSVELGVEYAASGSGNWIGVDTGTTFQEQYISGYEYSYDGEYFGGVIPVYSWRTIAYPHGKAVYSNSTSKPLRVGINIAVTKGQYDIRIRKVTQNNTGTSSQNQVSWTQLKSTQENQTEFPGQGVVALSLKASGQLQGAIDELNWIATARPAPYWNGSAWVTATDTTNGLSNPGTQILQLVRGIYDENDRLVVGLGWDDSQIDLESIKAFMVWCASKGFKFDAYIQNSISIGDLLSQIAYVGLGTISWDSGKIGITWMDDTQVIEGVINMANIKAKSFGVSYAVGERADEIEYGYFDKTQNNQWNSLRVQSPAVTTPSSTARLSNLGVTSEAHAAILARHSMGQNLYMSKSITFDQDLEYMTYRRGSVLALSHDLTQWGYGGRIKGVVNNSGILTLTLDDEIPANSTRFIGLRLLGETQYRIFTVNAFTGSTREITLGETWPSGVPVIGDGSNVMDCLWVYDFVSTPGLKVSVTKIEPSGDGARITVTPVPDEFWPYVWSGAYTPPPNRSLLNKVPNVTSGLVREVLSRQGNTFYTELTVQFEIENKATYTQIWGSIGGAPIALMGQVTGNSFTWTGGLDETWNIELRAFNGVGQHGTVYRISHEVQGLKAPPDDVTNFFVDGSILNWTPVTNIDVAGYKIRFNYGENTWWPTATPLHEGLITETPFDLVNRPSGLVTVLIKAVDTTGNESENAAVITMNLGDTLVDNVLFSYPQHTAWLGTKTGSTVVGGELLANTNDLFYEDDSLAFYGNDGDLFYQDSKSGAMSYEFSVIPTASGTLKLDYDFTAANYLIEYRLANSNPFYGVDSNAFYESDTGLFYGDVSAWQTWPSSLAVTSATGEITFRVSTLGGVGQEKFSTLTAIIDVPDITVTLDDVIISSSGTRLAIGTVNAVKNVQITCQSDGNGGVTARIVDKSATLGPLIQVLNATGTAVNGKIDAIVQAY